MKRNELIEKQFKQRYNRDIEAYRKIYTEDDEVKQADVKIIHNGNEYMLIEYLKDGLTEQALFKHKEKTWKYKTHLEAEVHCADMIGKEK